MKKRINIAAIVDKMQTAVQHLASLCPRKRFFTLLLAVANSSLFTLHSSLFIACTSEETTRTAGSQQRPIAFKDAYTVQPTRSSTKFTATKGIPVGQSMGVYAYLHDTDARNYLTDTPNFMWNQQATSQEDKEPFTYEPLKYWPNDENSKLSFIAYFPYCNGAENDGTDYDIASTGVEPLLANNGTGLPTFNFTVKNNVDDQVDFLVSEVVANLPKSRDTEGDPHQPFNDLTIYDRVPFLFKHMMAKVEFRIVADAEIRKDIVKFQLTKLRVSNLFKDGTLTPTYNPATGITSFTWHSEAPTNTKQDYYDFKTYVPQLLMPQTIGDDVMLSLDYSITFKSDGTTYHYVYENETPKLVTDEEYTYSNAPTLQLNTMKRTDSDEALTEWLPNHHYVYTIRLRANRIDFTGQVVDWGEYDDSDIIDIKE